MQLINYLRAAWLAWRIYTLPWKRDMNEPFCCISASTAWAVGRIVWVDGYAEARSLRLLAGKE